MAELFKLVFIDESIMRIVYGHLTYKHIPKEWVGYKFIFKEALDLYSRKNVVPSLGVVSQKYATNEDVQEAIEEIKEARLVDRDLIIDQLESFIKETDFEILSQRVHDLYEEGKKEEAIQLNAEESKRINELSLRMTGNNFVNVVAGFEERMEERKVEEEDELKEGLKEKIPFGIDGLDDRSHGGANRTDTILWIARSGIGKAESLDSDVMTPKGIVKMKDIVLGQEIFGIDGKKQKVIGIYPQGILDCYEIEFTDGTKVKCNDKHVWTVFNKRSKHRLQNLTTAELIERGLNLPSFRNGEKYVTKKGTIRYGNKERPKWSIPNIQAVEFESQKILIDPYTMGALLGDGSFCTGQTILFTNPEKEIVERMIFPENQFLTIYKGKRDYDYAITKGESKHSMYWYLSQYKLEGRKSIEKFIPKEYIFNSKEIRLELLRGLLDTDGYVSKEGVIELALTSKQLIEDAIFIARSLGCLCHEVKQMKSGYKKNGEYIQCKDHYRVRIVPPKGLDLFHLTRKSQRLMQEKKKYCVDRAIKSIRYIGKEAMQCIEVSNEDGLYLTNNFIATHNSTMLKWQGFVAAIRGFSVLHIQLEGGVDAAVTKYEQMWTLEEYSKLKRGNISEDKWKQIKKMLKQMQEFNREITVYGFKRFGEASVLDIRERCVEYQRIYGKFPDLLVVDSLDLLKTGTNKKLDNDPEYKKEKLQKVAQLLKDLAVELNCVVATATQTSDVPMEIWNNEDKVIDRSYTEGDKTLVKPFSFVYTINMTIQEKKNHLCRIYVDKLRDYRGDRETFSIATNYEQGRFYDKKRTLEMYEAMDKSKDSQESNPTKKKKVKPSKGEVL